jgi:hypothetical protein
MDRYLTFESTQEIADFFKKKNNISSDDLYFLILTMIAWGCCWVAGSSGLAAAIFGLL